MVRRVSLPLVVVIALLFVAGCSKSPSSKMVGEYVEAESKSTLAVTADKMTFGMGPISLALNYKVVKTEGNNVTVELSEGGKDPVQETIAVADDYLDFTAAGPMKGKWTRKK
jgi:hypothetical protein